MSEVLNNLEELFPILMKNNNYAPNSMIGNNHIYFHANGIQIDKWKTLEENYIKDNTFIIFSYLDFNQINVSFILDFLKINDKIPFMIYIFFQLLNKNYIMNI